MSEVRIGVDKIVWGNSATSVPIEFLSKIVFILRCNGRFKGNENNKLTLCGYLHPYSHLYGWMEISDLENFGIKSLWVQDRTGEDPRRGVFSALYSDLLSVIGSITIIFKKGIWRQEVETIYQMTNIDGGQNFGTHYSQRLLKKNETPPAFTVTSSNGVGILVSNNSTQIIDGSTLITHRVGRL